MPRPKKPTPSDIGRALVAIRNANLTPERRREIAVKAAKARWSKEKRRRKKPLK